MKSNLQYEKLPKRTFGTCIGNWDQYTASDIEYEYSIYSLAIYYPGSIRNKNVIDEGTSKHRPLNANIMMNTNTKRWTVNVEHRSQWSIHRYKYKLSSLIEFCNIFHENWSLIIIWMVFFFVSSSYWYFSLLIFTHTSFMWKTSKIIHIYCQWQTISLIWYHKSKMKTFKAKW